MVGKASDGCKVTGRRVETFCIAVSPHSLLAGLHSSRGDIINLLRHAEWLRPDEQQTLTLF